MKTISKTKFNLIGHKEDRSNRIFHKIKDLRAEKSYAIALLAVPSCAMRYCAARCVTVLARSARCATVPRRAAMYGHHQLNLQPTTTRAELDSSTVFETNIKSITR